jgi:Tat protein secretion system quality control protein TatD with DNase activity
MTGGRLRPLVVSLVLALLPATVAAADYDGPLIDAHAHLPDAKAIDTYVDAMKRHGIRKVVLLGSGGVQRQDAEWIAAAVRSYPEMVVPGVPVPDPTRPDAAGQLDVELARTKARVMGEVDLRHAARKIDRNPSERAFVDILQLGGQRGVPVVVHDELTTPAATAALEKALGAQREAVVVLAHAGSAAPADLEKLLGRNGNLMVDLSGLHFERTPRLASERGPLDARWKALIEKMPERFLMGLDVWAPRTFESVRLDRLLRWTRRVLGQLTPEVAERVAWKNAVTLFRLD